MCVKPILFNTKMVRAILDGRKSCTRRVIKPQPQSRLCYTYACSRKGCIGKWTYPNRGAHELWGEEYKLPENIKDEELSKQWNPPYHTDDILYVRETWKNAPNGYYYYEDWQRNDIADVTKWKPSIHMPKEAARIWLEVTNVRVERLQDITIENALKEGVDKYIRLNGELDENSIITSFIGIWNSTVKKSDLDFYGWDANPYVWVIEFEVCDKPESEG